MVLGNGVMSNFASTTIHNKYAQVNGGGRREDWHEIAARQAHFVVRPYLLHLEEGIRRLIEERKFMPGGRYLYGAGRRYPQVNNCFLFRAEDSREGWGLLMNNVTNALMTGGGVGVVYSLLRPEDALVAGMGGKSTGPCALMRMVNEAGRYIMQGGSRRSAIWAGLHWNHPDVFKFMHLKDWSPLIHQCRREDFTFAAPMDGTNISIILDDAFFEAYAEDGARSIRSDCPPVRAREVYWAAVRRMLETGEPGFSVDVGENAGEHLRNACTEVTSSDDCDMCNLGSINMARIDTLEEFALAVELGTAFLLCGTLYSKLPIPCMYQVREKNRRLGLGLMGVHEWLLKRGRRYGPDPELGQWLAVYASSGAHANRYSDKLSLSRPVATRSVAPTGTISIAAETTSGIEPVFASAYKRRYLDGREWKCQYVLDATAKRLVDNGVDPSLVEDAFTLAEDVGRRVQFQRWVQGYVDHGISSTINLPEWGSSLNNENTVDHIGKQLMEHLPGLRGITAYPNGSRGGQPLNRVPWTEAVKHVGHEFAEGRESSLDFAEDDGGASCKNGFCSS